MSGLGLKLVVVYGLQERERREEEEREKKAGLCQVPILLLILRPHSLPTSLLHRYFFAGHLSQPRNNSRKSATLALIIGSPASYIIGHSLTSPDISSGIILPNLLVSLADAAQISQIFSLLQKSKSRSSITCSPTDPPISISRWDRVSQSGFSDKMTPRFAC